jgi:hypothetical protein
MTAPFPLPDVVTVTNVVSIPPVVIYADMPVRLVPSWKWDRPQFDNPNKPMWWTHWIDFDPQYELEATEGWLFDDEDSLVFAERMRVLREVVLPGGTRKLFEGYTVVWVEERYTNRDKWYRRAYLLRISTQYVDV